MRRETFVLDAESRLLAQLGLNFELPDSGCCGMAGSFGFEEKHYDISMKVGEHSLLPAVRESAKDTLIVADGFSCKHQIMESTDPRALHLAQVQQMALRESPDGPPAGYPETRYPDVRLDGPERQHALAKTAMALGAGALVAGGLWWAWKKGRRYT